MGHFKRRIISTTGQIYYIEQKTTTRRELRYVKGHEVLSLNMFRKSIKWV